MSRGAPAIGFSCERLRCDIFERQFAERARAINGLQRARGEAGGACFHKMQPAIAVGDDEDIRRGKIDREHGLAGKLAAIGAHTRALARAAGIFGHGDARLQFT